MNHIQKQQYWFYALETFFLLICPGQAFKFRFLAPQANVLPIEPPLLVFLLLSYKSGELNEFCKFRIFLNISSIFSTSCMDNYNEHLLWAKLYDPIKKRRSRDTDSSKDTKTERQKPKHRERSKHRETKKNQKDTSKYSFKDRQIDRRTERQTDRQTDRQRDRQMDGQMDRQTDGQMDRQVKRESVL